MAEMVGTGEAARVLGVDDSTVRRWCEAGELPAEKVGRAWRIDRQVVEERRPDPQGLLEAAAGAHVARAAFMEAVQARWRELLVAAVKGAEALLSSFDAGADLPEGAADVAHRSRLDQFDAELVRLCQACRALDELRRLAGFADDLAERAGKLHRQAVAEEYRAVLEMGAWKPGRKDEVEAAAERAARAAE